MEDGMQAAAAAPPRPPRNHHNPHGALRPGGSRSGGHFHHEGPSRESGHRGRGDRRARGRGKGHQIGHQRLPGLEGTLQVDGARSQALSQNGAPGGRPTDDTSSVRAEKNGATNAQFQEAVADDADGEVCFICASTIEHTSIAPCNHQTCHVCSLRWRALYKTRACAHCRSEAPFVIFTDEASKRFEEFTDADFVKIDDNLGIKYEKDVILEDTVLLLRYNCPDDGCDVACLGWPDLHRHVKTKHGKIMCDLCTRNKRSFTHEHQLFTYGELRKHEKFGDDNPGAVDQSGFRGHPECGFCRERFYGDDELYNHCREKHEKCHICERRNGGRHPQYYLNYQMLEKHFQDAHFVCLDAECQANKTNVFESEMDLKAHQLTEHPNGLSKDARRDARLVDISGFSYRTPYQPEGRGGREHRSGGRGRDPNSEPLPASSAQPIGRAELAYQRQIAIQSAQSVSTRHFGGQLTQTAPSPAPWPAQPQQNPPLPPLDSLNLDSSTTRSTTTPQEQARQLGHAAVMERASNLLKYDQNKLSTFRTHVSSYRSSTIPATDLIDAFFSLFDTSSTELGKLIRELADIYENESKRTQLLEAWNNWRSINEDYPSLPGPAGVLPGLSSSTVSGGTSTSGRRVLRLKASTAQSSRSAVARQGSWGNALDSGRPTDPFPALAGATRQPNGLKKTPWAGATTSTPSRSSPANSRPSSRPRATMGARASEEMFPSLPATAKPNTLMAGLTRGGVSWEDRRTNKPPGANPWGLSPTPAQAAAVSAPIQDGGVDEAASKRKGKKGKGLMLYHFG